MEYSAQALASCPCCGRLWDSAVPKTDAGRVLFPLQSRLSPQRTRLLRYLVENFGEWTPRHKIAGAISLRIPGESQNDITQKLIDVAAVQMSRLRRNIEPYGFTIETRRHYGSRLKRIAA
jgi:DNA-binding response OmpR family regulator